MVVEVVLAGHLATLGGQQAAERVADGSPAGTTQVNRTGGVSRDEFQVDLCTLVGMSAAEVLASGENVLDDLALRSSGQADVDESRAGDAGLVDLRAGGQLLSEPRAQLAGVGSRLLGGLHGDVGGVVAVLWVAWALNRRVIGDDGGVQATLGEDLAGDACNEFGKFCWSHA